MSEALAPSTPDNDNLSINEKTSNERADIAREQEVRRLNDDTEEKTAEVNEDDAFFGTIEDESWDGLVETAYNFHLQLAPSISCPICFRVTQFPIRQDCDHVLCFSCIQQSLSFESDCSLCQDQEMSKARKIEVVSGLEKSTGIFHANAGQDFHLPVSASSMFSTPYQAVSTGYDMSRVHQDLHVPLGLDNLSDLDEVIDLDDLVSSDSEWPSPPVAARTSLSQSFIAGPARLRRTSLRRMSTCSSGQASVAKEAVNKTAPTVARTANSQVGKRKARTCTVKRKELAILRMEWVTVRSVGLPPDPRYDCGLAIHGNIVIVVGGIVGKLRLNDLHTLDLAAKPSPQWAQPPISGTPPPSGHLLQIFVIGDDLYAIGGTIDGKFLTELHRLNVKEWKWEKVEVAGTPPSMRYWYSLAVMQSMAILYGGYGHPQRLSDTFALRFDTEIPTWVELRPRGDLPGPSSTHSVCVIEDRMYIFGGYDGKYRRGQLFAFEIEDASKECIECVWRKVETQGDGPASRYTHSGVSIGSQLIVYGGNTGCLKGDAYVLELGTADAIPTWKQVKCDPPLSPRAWHRAVTWNGAMYVFGGNTTNGHDNSVIRVAFTA